MLTGTACTSVLRQQVIQETGITDEEFWAAQEPIVIQAMASGDYPEMAQLPGDPVAIAPLEALEFGLGPLLDGLEAFIARRRDT